MERSVKRTTKIDVFSFTNALKVLSFLAAHPEEDYTASEVQAATGLSRPGVYVALRDLIKQGLVFRKSKGKLYLYIVDSENPIVRQFKVLAITVMLSGLVERLRPVSRKVILFGSSSRGEDRSDSDIDLFVLAKDNEHARNVISSYKSSRKLQAVVKTAVEFADLKSNDTVFFNEVNRGIVLWEGKDEYGI